MMRRYSLLVLLVVSIAFCSRKMSAAAKAEESFNSNSWSVSINKKILLASWKNNRFGDTAIIDLQKIKQTDTLFVSQHLCGNDGRNSSTTLTIRNSKGEIIKESISKNESVLFVGSLPVIDMLNSNRSARNEILDVHFSIDDKKQQLNYALLIARVKLK